jgi:hypothetical protein
MNLGDARIALRVVLQDNLALGKTRSDELAKAMEAIARALLDERLKRMEGQIERFVGLLEQVREAPADIDLRCNTSRRMIGLASPPLCPLCQGGPCRLHQQESTDMVRIAKMAFLNGRVVVDGRAFTDGARVTIGDDGTVTVDTVLQDGKIGDVPPEHPLDKLPRYRSHKIVRAAQIAWWHQGGIGPIDVHVDIDGARHVIEAPPDTFARGAAVVGDYIVVYDDGYISWSPRQAFEDGYTRVEE